MARKDAELVIRAKDEAASVLDKITKALGLFTDAQHNVDDQAEKTESSLGRLGAALGKLDKAVNSLEVGGKLTSDMDKAGQAVARLETIVGSTQDELAKQARRLKETSAAADRFADKMDGAAEAVKRQQTAVARAKADQKKLSDSYKEAASAQAKLAKSYDALPAKLEKQAAKVETTRQRYEKLRVEIEKADKPSKTLQNQFEASGRALEKQQGILTGLTGQYDKLKGQLAEAGATVEQFAARSERAAQQLAKQETILGKIKTNYDGLKTSTRSSTQEQSRLEGQVEKTGNVLVRQTQQLDRAEDAFLDLATSAGKTEAALKGLENISLAQIEGTLVEQGMAARKAREDFKSLETAAAALKEEYGALGVPTRQMMLDLREMAQRVDEAELKFMAQEEALERMGRAYRDGSKDLEGLRATAARFGAEQSRLSQAMSELGNDGLKARNAIRTLTDEAISGVAPVRKLASETKRLSEAQRKVASETGGLGAAYRALYGDTRKALSLNQRLRGEVLSLVAAYGGLYGVIELLGRVIEAYQVLEAATARINVATDGNFAQTEQEMDFVRRTADRLGIELGVLANEYSKLAIASKGTNLEGERTRHIFLAVAEAARVARTSNDELKGVFVAINQIVSKGAVQLEELKGQLGDRLPGALQIMADGLGITTAELIKLTEQGLLTSDALVPFADELNRRFGGQLNDSLDSTAVAIGRLKNAAFQAMTAFGNGGFIDSFTALANQLAATLMSADFQAFAARASAALAVVIDALSLMADNFQLVAAALGAFMGIKLIPFLGAMYDGLRNAGNAARVAAADVRVAAASTTALGTAASGTTARVAGLTAAVRTLLASTGVGLLVALVGAGIAGWATEADAASEALVDHRDMLDSVRNAYDEVNGSVEKWRKTLVDTSVTEARENLRRVQEALSSAMDEFTRAQRREGGSFATRFFGQNLGAGASAEYQAAVAEVMERFEAGRLEADRFRAALDKVNEQYRDGSVEHARYATEIDTAAVAIVAAKTAVTQAESTIAAMTDETEEGQKAFDDLGNSAADADKELEAIRRSGEAAAKAQEALNKQVDALTDGLRGMLRQFPRFEEHLDRIEEHEAFLELRDDAIQAAKEILDVERAWLEMSSSVTGTSFSGLFMEFFTDLDGFIRRIEGVTDAMGGLAGRMGQLGGIMGDAVGGSSGFFNLISGGFSGADDKAIEEAVNRLIWVESGANPSARAQDNAPAGVRATATGLGQFIESTWLQLFRQQFPNEASKMTEDAILALRTDPDVNYAMTTAAVKGYIKSLEGAGLPVNNSSIYLSHFLGESGAKKALSVPGNDPFAQHFPEQARSNPFVADKTMSEAISILSQKMLKVTDEQIAKAAAFNPNYDQPQFAERASDTAETISDNDFAIRQQELMLAGKEKQALVEEAIRDARKENPALTDADITRITQQTERTYELKKAEEQLTEEQREQKKLAEEAAAQREATKDALSDAEFEVRQQQLKNEGLERQAMIEAAIRDAKAADPNIRADEIAKITEQTSRLYDLQVAASGETREKKAAEKAQDAVNALLARRNSLEEQYEQLKKRGDMGGAAAIQTQMAAINDELLKAIENAKALWAAVGGEDSQVALEALNSLTLQAQDFGTAAGTVYLNWSGVADFLVQGMAGAFDNFARNAVKAWDAVQDGTQDSMELWRLARDAFLQFAGDFLLYIARMIIQQAIFNALKAAFGGTTFGGLIGLPGMTVGTGHTGGLVGSSRVGSGNNIRTISPYTFAGAQRYHTGGMIGLSPNEVPIIAKKGEEMLTEDDPFHEKNRAKTLAGMGGQKDASKTKIVNVIDGSAMLEQALQTEVGEKLMMNWIRSNSEALGFGS